MHVKVNEENQRCEVWVSNSEASHYKQMPEYAEILHKFKSKGYQVCVYVGGNAPLIPSITALLNNQSTGSITM